MTAPLIALTGNEAELAGVIGHEVGHVVARHAAERMYVMEKEQNKTWLFAAGGGIVGAAAGFGLKKLLCADGDSACLAKAALIGAAGTLWRGTTSVRIARVTTETRGRPGD